jgi:hypothetical protein
MTKSVITKLGKPFVLPVGVQCFRDRMKCESYRYDKVCNGSTCPFNGKHK